MIPVDLIDAATEQTANNVAMHSSLDKSPPGASSAAGNLDDRNEAGEEPVGPPPSGSGGAIAGVTSGACATHSAVIAKLQAPSQVSDRTVNEIVRDISGARLARYLDLAVDKRQALQLHTWNATLAGSLLPALQIAEVTIRNLAIARAKAVFSKRGPWYDDPDLLRKLGKDRADILSNAINDRKALLGSKASVQSVTDYLARDLTFGFWVTFYSNSFHSTIWPSPLQTYVRGGNALPRGFTISKLHMRIEDLRVFRNDVAHHKNLISKIWPTAFDRYESCMRTLSMISPAAANHARSISVFPNVWACCPIPIGEFSLLVALMNKRASRIPQ